ncbi:MAG: leucine-rich repeat protein [Blautia sp.]|jgi:hypothetical protein
MKNKTILSLFLAALLAVSSLPDTAMGAGFQNTGFEAETESREDTVTPESDGSQPSKEEPDWTPEDIPFQAEGLGAPAQKTEDTQSLDTALPGPEDYSFSGGTIHGLKNTYLNSLTEEQKKNIQLVIPAAIGNTPVTAIGDAAFRSTYNSNYTGCHFTAVDLTQATSLTSIGKNAFYGEKLEGSLTIPEGVTTIGDHAFRDCSTLTGSLSLPSTLVSIGQYAFSECGFSGTLSLPENLNTIGNNAFRIGDSLPGFSGELRIPANLTTLGPVSFSGQKQITSLVFEGNSLTELPNSVFRYCSSLKGAIKIPDSIQSIGENTFGGTGIQTIYLPKLKDPNNTSLIKSNTFGTYSTTKLNAIVCEKEDFNAVQTMAGSSYKTKVGYETKIQFSSNGNTIEESATHLFNRPYYYQKDAGGVWAPDSAYQFPIVTDDTGKAMAWRLTPTSVQAVPVNAIITTDILYAFIPLPDPQYTFGPDIDKTYDGLPAKLTVEASHPNYKNVDEAQPGDVLFYYTWSWGTIGYSPNVLQGFDENIYEFTDVREPRFAIGCQVKIQACVLSDDNKAKVFHTTIHDFSVSMHQAKPTLHPFLPGKVNIADGLPEITLTENDSPGTIVWDECQVLQKGSHPYTWTFTSVKNNDGGYNYETIQGTATLYGVDGEVSPVYIQKPDHGRIEIPASAEGLPTEDVLLEFYPDQGYQLDTVWLDDMDITDQISGNTLTITNVQGEHHIRASFRPIPAPPSPPVHDDTPSIIEKPTEEKPDQPTTAEPKQPIYTDSQGNGTLDESKIEAVIRAAENAAQAEGHQTGIALSIPVQSVSDATGLNIQVPEETLDTLISHQVNYMDIQAKGQLSYHLPMETIQELGRQSQGDGIIISAAPITELPENAADVVGARPAYDITILRQADGKPVPITDLNGMTLGLKIPYSLAEDEDSSKVYSTYIDDAGNVHWMKASYLPEEQAVNFDLVHFSSYGVGYLDMDATPASVTGKDTKNISIRWAKEELAQGYSIWYRSEQDEASSRKVVSGTEQLSYRFGRLKPGTKYFFTVRPWVLTEEGYVFGTPSTAIRGTTKPEAAKIRAVLVASGKPKVVLAGPAAGAGKYSMCYSKTPDFKEFKVGIRTKYTARTFTNALPEGTYYVRVKSYRDLGGGKRVYGEWSNTVKVPVAIS